MLSRFSCDQGKRSTFSVGRWLARGWVYTSCTRLAAQGRIQDCEQGGAQASHAHFDKKQKHFTHIKAAKKTVDYMWFLTVIMTLAQ